MISKKVRISWPIVPNAAAKSSSRLTKKYTLLWNGFSNSFSTICSSSQDATTFSITLEMKDRFSTGRKSFNTSVFRFSLFDLGQKYYAPQVRCHQGSNS